MNDTNNSHAHDKDARQMVSADDALQFILASVGKKTHGPGIFTIVSTKTGQRFTYSVKRAMPEKDADGKVTNEDRPYFVKVLTGSDNTSDYSYLGTIFPSNGGPARFVHTRTSRISAKAPSHIAFSWFFAQLTNGAEKFNQVEFWHEGSCGKCGKRLSVPLSIDRGYGPKCFGKLGL